MKLTRVGQDLILNPEAQKYTLIWLHGLGDTAQGFVPVFNRFSLLEDCKYVLLTAPKRPVTVNGGIRMNSWFDIKDMNKRDMNDEVKDSAARVGEVIFQEMSHHRNVFLGGFSQGGALALYTGLVYYSEKLKGIISLSGYAMNYVVPNTKLDVPVFLYNGKKDMTVSYDLASQSYEKYLKGVKYSLHIEDYLDHSISPKEMSVLRNWLRERVDNKK